MSVYTEGETGKINRKKPYNHYKNSSVYAERSYEEAMQRELKRKRIKKQNAEKLKFLAFCFLILTFLMPKIFFDNLDLLLLRRIQNRNINYDKTVPLVQSGGLSIWDDGHFLDTKILDEINTNDPLMKAPNRTDEMRVLKYRLKNLAITYPQIEAGIFIWDYNTGRYVDINANEVFPTASIIKLPVLFQMYRRVEKGLINLDEKLSVEDFYIAEGSGYLQYVTKGAKFTYKTLAELMIRQSDNTATNIILASVGGMNELNREIKRWGLRKTSMSNWLPDLNGTNLSTPAEMGTILYNLSNTSLLSMKSSSEIVEIMSRVRNTSLIRSGLPDDVMFIHKTGDIGEMLGDAGIATLPDGRRYIISIMVKRPYNSFAAKEFIVKASKMVYDSYITQTQ